MADTARAYSGIQTEQFELSSKPKSGPRKLWLCAYFPYLPLESLGINLTKPAAILETVEGKPCLKALSEPARHAGVETGMAPAAALALCPELSIHLRDSVAEYQALQRLAEVALNFSPWINRDHGPSLLLEIGGCLRLFGGGESLRENLRQTLVAQGHQPQIAISPAPAASVLLARLGLENVIADRQALRSLLGSLPITALALDDKTLRRLSRAGIRRLTDLWRLPRDGLARRYGPALLRQLDALAGQSTEVLSAFQAPPRFYARRDMPAELDRIEHFFPAIAQLAEELLAFLLARDATALGIDLEILHHRRPATRLELNFRNGSRDAKHWLALLNEKLDRSPLPAPVITVGLSCEAIAPFRPEFIGLFDDEPTDGEREWQALLDQLQARLGHQALKGLYLQDDHRPERAMGTRAGPALQAPELPARPLWLLTKPQALDVRGLQLKPEIERIESGWWDGMAMRRDYRIALDDRGRRLWVFQDLTAEGGWYLHGLFG